MWDIKATAASKMKGVQTIEDFDKALSKAEQKLENYKTIWPLVKTRMQELWNQIKIRKLKSLIE